MKISVLCSVISIPGNGAAKGYCMYEVAYTHPPLSLSLSPSPQARSEEEVLSDKQGLEQERVWVVHRAGFSLGTVQAEDTSAPSNFSSHFSIIRYQVRRVSGRGREGVCVCVEEGR